MPRAKTQRRQEKLEGLVGEVSAGKAKVFCADVGVNLARQTRLPDKVSPAIHLPQAAQQKSPQPSPGPAIARPYFFY